MIHGKAPLQLNNPHNHWDRILWLTSQIESGGKFGSVMAYDGTGMTGGLIQAVAVYLKALEKINNNPAEEQGSLWELLTDIKESDSTLLSNLDAEFDKLGWQLRKGKIYQGETSNLIRGKTIRDILTPTLGTVPRIGPNWENSKAWAILFHEIFSDERSFAAQKEFGIKHFKRAAKRKLPLLNKKSIESIFYNGNIEKTTFKITNPLDLALSFLFSNMVNSPTSAFTKLKEAIESTFPTYFTSNSVIEFNNQTIRTLIAKAIIQALAKGGPARWSYELPNGRYQRTRRAAKNVWRSAFFKDPTGLMPPKF